MQKANKVMIEAINVTKRYGGRTVVDHVTLRVEKGQIFGLLGPNAAGIRELQPQYRNRFLGEFCYEWRNGTGKTDSQDVHLQINNGSGSLPTMVPGKRHYWNGE